MSLDDFLAAWAAGVRLPEPSAARMYRDIVATPVSEPAPAPEHRPVPGLDPAWWRTFAADHASRMVASTRPVAVPA